MTDAEKIALLRKENRRLEKLLRGRLFGKSWQRMNKIRGDLIDKEIAGTITEREQRRLDQLQAEIDQRISATYTDRWQSVVDLQESALIAQSEHIKELKKELQQARRKKK